MSLTIRALLVSALLIVPTGASAAVIYAPSTPSGGIVGFNLQNTGSAQSARYVTFGQPFVQGAISASTNLVATINGQQSPAQMDIKTTYSDGSVRFAVITVLAPALSASQTVGGYLSTGGSAGTPINLATALSSYNVSVNLTGGVTNSINATAQLQSALSSGKATYWLRGPLATQARVDVPVTSSLHIIFDITAYADGTFSTDAQFANDYAMQATGGTLSYTATISQNGNTAYTSPSLKHYQYQHWHKVVYSGTAPAINVQHDVAYLIKTGVFPNYDLTTGIDSGAIENISYTPLGSGGYTLYMPNTGDRTDVGPTTGWNINWLLTQDKTAAQTAINQADTAGSIPWHFFDPATGDYISLDKYPSLWADGRGTPTLTQSIAEPTWTLDVAHHPDAAFVPYVMTGARVYLDQINAQATAAELLTWNGPRQDGKGLVLTGTALEVRAQAWALRDVDEAAWANPDGTTTKNYWNKILDNNYTNWISNQMPVYTVKQGAVHGYIDGENRNWPPEFGTWQQDYMTSSVAASALRGNAKALAVLQWMSNFIVGRVTNAANGMPVAEASQYEMILADSSGKLFTTWAQVGSANSASIPDNANFPALVAMGVASVYNVTGDPVALQGYNTFQALNPFGDSSAAYSAIAQYRTSQAKFHIVPKSGAVTQPPSNPVPTATFSASPTSITSGQSSTLSWSSTNATSCSGTGFTASGTSGSVTVSPTNTAVYSVACSGTGGTGTASATVTVSTVTPPSTKFSVGDRVQVTSGTLNVRSTPSTSGTLLGSQAVGVLGTVVGGPTSANGYTWWNINYDSGADGWSVEDNLTKTTTPTPTPTPAPTATLSANPPSITSGGSATLTWSSTNATSCTGTGFSASGASGSASVSPTATATYSVTCTGAGGTSPLASATVTVSTVVTPPSTKFSIGDRVQVTGGRLNVRSAPSTSAKRLGRQSVGAMGTVLGGPTSANGYIWWNVNYDSGADGWSVEDNLTKVTIQPPAIPTASLSASPTSITSGGSATLSWSSTNAASCTGTGFTASGTSGSLTVSPTANTTYALTCTGAGGTASASVAVSVGAVIPLPIPTGNQVCVGTNCSYTSIQSAFSAASDGATVTISGEWTTGGAISANNVTIKGTSGARLTGGAVQDKGIMVITGTGITVQDLECSGAAVTDGNGACVRFEGSGNLTIRNVNFHDNQDGVLAAANTGVVTVENSIFKNNGFNASSGYAHGIYMNGAELVIRNSQFLSSKLGGHEIKSRANKTTLENNVIASLDGVDSRNIDIPNGGVVVIRNNVIEKGPNSENNNSIGIGLEGVTKTTNSILIEGNYIILERNGTNVLLQTAGMPASTMTGNTIIGGTNPGGSNTFFSSRTAAGIAAYPFLPPVPSGTTPPPTPAPTATLSASPTSITAGGSATLSWSSTNATSCTGTGFTASGASGSVTVSPTATATYSLTCTGAGGTSLVAGATVSVTAVTPTPEPTPTGIQIGDRVKLTTNTNTRATANGTILGQQLLDSEGTVIGGPSSAGGYSWLQVNFDTGLDGWIAAQYLVEIAGAPTPAPTPAPTATLAGSPTSITSGQSSTLTWSSTDATSCTASGAWSGTKATSGTESVSPTASVAYILTCTGEGGSASAQTTITVSAPPETLTLGANTIFATTDSGDTNYINAVKFTSGSKAGTAQSMSVYIVADASAVAPKNQYSMAIYADNGGTPGALIAKTGNSTVSSNAWNTLPITAIIAANTTYWLAYSTNGENNFKIETGSTNQIRWVPQTFGSWPDNFGSPEGSSAHTGSIYVTYVTGGEVLGPKAFRFYNTLAKTWTGPEVTFLQSILRKLGFFTQEPTGYFGNQTAAAVSAFQRAFGLEPVGIVGPKTRALLNGQ